MYKEYNLAQLIGKIWEFYFRYMMTKMGYCDTALMSIRKVAIIPRFVTVTSESNCTRNSDIEAEIARVMFTVV